MDHAVLKKKISVTEMSDKIERKRKKKVPFTPSGKAKDLPKSNQLGGSRVLEEKEQEDSSSEDSDVSITLLSNVAREALEERALALRTADCSECMEGVLTCSVCNLDIEDLTKGETCKKGSCKRTCHRGCLKRANTVEGIERFEETPNALISFNDTTLCYMHWQTLMEKLGASNKKRRVSDRNSEHAENRSDRSSLGESNSNFFVMSMGSMISRERETLRRLMLDHLKAITQVEVGADVYILLPTLEWLSCHKDLLSELRVGFVEGEIRSIWSSLRSYWGKKPQPVMRSINGVNGFHFLEMLRRQVYGYLSTCGEHGKVAGNVLETMLLRIQAVHRRGEVSGDRLPVMIMGYCLLEFTYIFVDLGAGPTAFDSNVYLPWWDAIKSLGQTRERAGTQRSRGTSRGKNLTWRNSRRFDTRN